MVMFRRTITIALMILQQAALARSVPGANRYDGSASAPNAIVQELLSQARVAAETSTPSALLPETLFHLGEAAGRCSTGLALPIMSDAFATALKTHVGERGGGPSKSVESNAADVSESASKRAIVDVVKWLTTVSVQQRRQDLLTHAEELASRVKPQREGISSQAVHAPILKARLERGEEDDIRRLFGRVAEADGRFPFELAVSTIESKRYSTLASELYEEGSAALALGQCGTVEGLKFVDIMKGTLPKAQVVDTLRSFLRNTAKRTGKDAVPAAVMLKATSLLAHLEGREADEAANKVEAPREGGVASEGDRMVQLFQEFQEAASESAAALSQRALAVSNPKLRQQMLISCETALRSRGESEAAQRVSGVLSSLMTTEQVQERPARLLLLARSTASGEALEIQIQRALGIAEKMLAEANQAYQEASGDMEKLAVYQTANIEAVAAYRYAAEMALPLAIESAQRVLGPQRADVLIEVLQSACEREAGSAK